MQEGEVLRGKEGKQKLEEHFIRNVHRIDGRVRFYSDVEPLLDVLTTSVKVTFDYPP